MIAAIEIIWRRRRNSNAHSAIASLWEEPIGLPPSDGYQSLVPSACRRAAGRELREIRKTLQ